MDQDDANELRSQLTCNLEDLMDRLQTFGDQALRLLDFDDSDEELRDQVLHVEELLLNLGRTL